MSSGTNYGRSTSNSNGTGLSRKRVAMISTHGYVAAEPILGNADTGGQVVYVLELSKEISRLGYAVDIWTRRFEDQPEIEQINEHVRIVRVPCGGSEFIAKEFLHEHMDEWAENALKFIEKERLSYELINSHYWDAGVGGQILAKALNVPHLHTPHSLGIWKMRQMEGDFPDGTQDFDALYNFTVRNREEKKLYRDCDAVAATTPIQTDMLVDDYDVLPGKLRIVSPGYDDARFYPVSQSEREKLREKFGFQGKAVLALGRLARNKGYDLLIRSFCRVLGRVPDARLYLAIGGNSLSDREQRVLDECKQLVANLAIKDFVTFQGHVPDADLADVYRAADLFVLSSRYEPFGMTATEAMACGTPVVATTHGGFWRVLRYGVDGLFADPFDSEDLGVTISKPLIHPGLASRLSHYGALHAKAKFTWTGAAKQLIKIMSGGSCEEFTAPEPMKYESLALEGAL